MDRELKSNYLKIDSSRHTFELHEKEPSTSIFQFCLKNAIIKFKEDKTIEVTGEKILWSICYERQFIEDIEDVPDDKYIRLGYKTIIDFLRGIRKPYVKSGWYKLKATQPYNCIASEFYIVL